MENMEEPSPKKIKRSFVKKSSIPEEVIIFKILFNRKTQNGG